MSVLAWVGVGLLIWRPMDAFSLGYQLSMGITGLLILLSDRKRQSLLDRAKAAIQPSLVRRGFVARGGGGILETARVNFACWVVALPTIAMHAGIVSLYAPVVSLVLIPMVMVLMVVGYVQVGVGVLAPGWGEHTRFVFDALLGGVNSFVGWVDGLAYSSVRVGDLSLVWVLIATALMVLVVIGRAKIRSWMTIGAIGLVVGWVFVEPMIFEERAALRIDMLDVGDGSCLLIQSRGRGLVWDCGSLDRRVGQGATRAARVVGLTRIEDAIVTHDNLDHFNGLVELAQGVGLKRVWVSRRMIDEPSRGWVAVSEALREEGVEIKEIKMGDTLVLGDATVECLWPNPDDLEGLGENDTSVVVRIEVAIAGSGRTRRVVLDGDIEASAMGEIERLYPGLDADVLEVPHHGSAKPGAFGYVDWIDPELVLQSTGTSRLNDPRWDRVRDERDWFSTADRGGVWVRIGRDGEITRGWARSSGTDGAD